jgi:pyruvate/2-oxoglutarate/acetoin dehydrogenase E1 component
MEAAKLLEAKHSGVSIEVIDIRTMNPLDKEAILTSIKKTNRALIVHEDTKTQGFGAEIAAVLSDEAFEFLDAPLKRVAALDTPIPYSHVLESAVLPQIADIVEAAEQQLNY